MVNLAIQKALATIYDGTLTVYGYVDTFDEKTKQTTQELSKIPSLSDIPCRLSFSTISQVKYLYEEQGVPNVTQVTKVFLAPDVVIPTGSIIEVKQNGFTGWFKNSGEPAIHQNHQEIILERRDEH